MYHLKWKREYNYTLLILFFYLVISFIMFNVFQRDYVWNGDDIYYNFQRIQGLSSNWLNNILAPNVSLNNFGKIGYGVNIFYPWLTLLPFKVISLFVIDKIKAYYLGLAFYFFISFLISHYSMKKLTSSSKLAILFSLIYNFSTYRLIEVFSRASLGEYIAGIFLPLCFLGFYNVFFGDAKSWRSLALGMSLIIYTHVLTTFMCVVVFILMLILFSYKISFNKLRIFSLIKAIISTLLITLTFTAPFISEELFQKYSTPDPQVLKGVSTTKLILASLDNSSERMVNGNTYNIGILLIISLILGAFALKKSKPWFKGAYIMFILTFLLSTTLFLWSPFQNTPISVIQYPFRILMFTTLFGSLILACTIAQLFKNYFENNFIVLTSTILILTMGLWISSIHNASGTLVTDKNSVITQKMINRGLIPDTYLAQYVPEKAQKNLPSMQKHILSINGKTKTIEPIYKGKSNVFILYNLKKDTKIVLPLVRYKFTKVYINGRPFVMDKKSSGVVKLSNLPSAKKTTIRVTYGDYRLFYLATILSLLGLIYVFLSQFQPIKIYEKQKSVKVKIQ